MSEIWYVSMHNKLLHYFRDMFEYKHELQEIRATNHDRLNLYPTHIIGARNVLRQNYWPNSLVDRKK